MSNQRMIFEVVLGIVLGVGLFSFLLWAGVSPGDMVNLGLLMPD